MMRTNTKKFKVIKFLAENDGTRYMEIERFICNMNGYNYDRRWNGGFNSGKRRYTGIWSTNLTCGPDSILKRYCHKVGNLWYVDADVKRFVDSQTTGAAEAAQTRAEIIVSLIRNKNATTLDTKKPNVISCPAPSIAAGLQSIGSAEIVDNSSLIKPEQKPQSPKEKFELTAIKDIHSLIEMRAMRDVISKQRTKLAEQLIALNDEISLAEKSLTVMLGLSHV